jgi:hypothetical protein
MRLARTTDFIIWKLMRFRQVSCRVLSAMFVQTLLPLTQDMIFLTILGDIIIIGQTEQRHNLFSCNFQAPSAEGACGFNKIVTSYLLTKQPGGFPMAFDTVDTVKLKAPQSQGHVAFVKDAFGVVWEVVFGNNDWWWVTADSALDAKGTRVGFRLAPFAVQNTFKKGTK